MSENTTNITKRRVYGFTGQFGAGKDHVARAAGMLRLSQAEPLHAVAHEFLGSADKSQPGVREFQQRLGLWLRGEVSPEAPYCVERTAVFEWIKHNLDWPGEAFDTLESAGFLSNCNPFAAASRDFLMEMVTRRVLDGPVVPTSAPAITSMRYPSEFAYLARHEQLDFVHVHIHAGSDLRKRRVELGYPEPDYAKRPHPSEQLAIDIDEGIAPDSESGLTSDGVVGDHPLTEVVNIKAQSKFHSVLVHNGTRFPNCTSGDFEGLGFASPEDFSAWVRAGGVFE